MKNYHEMTDHEINKEVEKLTGMYCEDVCGNYVSTKDYCNNPSDAHEIILQVWDKLMAPVFDSEGYYICTEWQATINFSLSEPNPLRAAMVVFLMMKDKENS